MFKVRKREAPGLLAGCLGGYYSVRGRLVPLDEPCVKELVERDEVQLRERHLVQYLEVAVFGNQIVGSSCKGAIVICNRQFVSITTGFMAAYFL